MNFCPNYAVVITALDLDKGKRFMLRTRCKQWSCPYCAPKNKRAWRYRIMKTIEDRDASVTVPYRYDNWYLWTLTLAPKHHKEGDEVKSLKKWRSVWNKLMGKLRYHLGKMMYVRVFETHKSGVLHVHMLCNRTFDDVIKKAQIENDGRVNVRHESEKLTKILLSYELGVVHDIKPIETKEYADNGHVRNVSAYVTKYMTKSVQSDLRQILADNDMTRVRIIQTSHGWAKIDSEPKLVWEVGRVLDSKYLSELREGIDLYDMDLDTVVEGVDFYDDGDYSVYPDPSEAIYK